MATSRDQLWQESSDWQGLPSTVQYKETSKGTPYMEVGFKIDGHMKFAKMWLTEKTEATTMARLKDLGFNGNFDAPALTRTEPVRLTCKHSEYNGKWYEEWTYWGEKQAAPINKSKVAQLSAAYKQIAGSAPTPRPAPVPMPKPVAPPPPVPAAPPADEIIASTEQEAWAFWCKIYQNEEERTKNWIACVTDIKPKSPEDWNRVAKVADLPF